MLSHYMQNGEWSCNLFYALHFYSSFLFPFKFFFRLHGIRVAIGRSVTGLAKDGSTIVAQG